MISAPKNLRPQRWWQLYRQIFYIVIVAIGSSGCASTIKREKEAKVAVLDRAIDSSRGILSDLKATQLPPENDIHFFLSYDVINAALTNFDGYSFTLPDAKDTTFHISSIRIGGYSAAPIVSLNGLATKGKLSVAIEISAIATSTNAMYGELKLSILQFTPKAKWWFLEFTKSEFVRSLLALKLNDFAEKMPIIKLPISQVFSLGGPAVKTSQNIQTSKDSTLDVEIRTPSTLTVKQLNLVRYAFLPNGIHIFAKIQ